MDDTTDSSNEHFRHERYMALLDTFKKHIEHYCVAHSNSRYDAEELIQEVFIAVWENIGSLHPESNPRQVNRWLQKVMRTVFIRHLRHRAKPGEALSEACEINVEEPDYDRELLEELVANLQADDQQLLRLRFEGYSNIEIAQQLGMRANTLNQRISRIVKKMKEIYTQIYDN